MSSTLRREVDVSAGPGHWRGSADLNRPSGKKVRCAVRHTIDYTADVVTVSFPRRCVSNPRWVRLGVGSFWAEGSTIHLDDALIEGRINPDTVRLSPRLTRG